MKLNKLTMEGFGSFAEETTVDLTLGVQYIFGVNEDRPEHADSNGSGKTTILDAISWALYGQTPSGRKKDGLINHLRDSMEVILECDGLVVKRTKKRGHGEKLRWHTGDGIWNQKDVKFGQPEVTKILGISFTTFCNTLYLTGKSKTLKFVTALPSERAEVLAELVDDEVFRRAGELILADLNQAEETKERAVIILHEIRDREEDMVKADGRLRSQLSEFTFQDKTRRTRVQKQIEALREEADKAHALLDNPPEMTMTEVQEHKQTFAGKLRMNNDRIASLQHLIDSIDTSLGEGSTCPTCRQLLAEEDAVELHELVENAEAEIAHIKDENIAIEDNIKELDEDQEYLRTYRAEAQVARAMLERVGAEVKLLRDELQPNDASHLHMMIEENKQKLEDLRKRKEDLEQQIFKASKEIPYLKELRKGFSVEVRNLMFDRLRGALEYYSNHYIRMLAGNEFTVEFPAQSSTGKEKFDIVLRSGTNTQVLEGYSGGETWRATFAVLLALRRILLEGNHCPASWLLVDDPVGELDETGARAFSSVLHGLVHGSEDGISQVLVTLPREIPGVTENHIRVVRQGRVSRLESV